MVLKHHSIQFYSPIVLTLLCRFAPIGVSRCLVQLKVPRQYFRRRLTLWGLGRHYAKQ